MSRLHPISWLALAAAAAIASPALAAPLPPEAAVASPLKTVDFQVYLPLRNPDQLKALLLAQHTPGNPQYQHWLTPAQFAAQFGPTAASVAKVQAALEASGLSVAGGHSRSLKVSGTVGRVNMVFGTHLGVIAGAGGREHFVSVGPMALPTALQQEGAKVLGFGNLHPRQPLSLKVADAHPDNRSGVTGVYWYNDLKQAYDYPSYQSVLPNTNRLDGTGVKAAVLMSDLIFPDDVQALFDHEGFTSTTGNPAPTVDTVLIDGGGNYNGGGSFEASLDVQQITGGAPGAHVTLFSIPDLYDYHIIDGYQAIVDDGSYDVVNSSFGGCELGYTAAYNFGTDYTYYLTIEDEIYQQGNAEGITFVASSGDEGGLQCPGFAYFTGHNAKFVKSVGTPAADPNVTAVGGGNLVTAHTGGSLDSSYVRESAYGDPREAYSPYGLPHLVSGGYWGAGGGVSTLFRRPDYQKVVTTGSTVYRTVPDVGMQVGGLGFSYNGAYCQALSCSLDDSSVWTAYGVGIGGGFYRTIGTSVSSPEFVGALALYIQKTGHRQGNINYYLYHAGAAQTKAGGVTAPDASQYYHRNIPGFDGYWYDTHPSQNYNYINGNGTPDVRKLFGMTAYDPAGTPETPSNP